jgi:hypothetical protein
MAFITDYLDIVNPPKQLTKIFLLSSFWNLLLLPNICKHVSPSKRNKWCSLNVLCFVSFPGYFLFIFVQNKQKLLDLQIWVIKFVYESFCFLSSRPAISISMYTYYLMKPSHAHNGCLKTTFHMIVFCILPIRCLRRHFSCSGYSGLPCNITCAWERDGLGTIRIDPTKWLSLCYSCAT